MTRTENALTKNKSAAILEWLLLFTMGVYLICLCVYNSTYVLPTYTFPDRPVFRLILCAATVLALGKMTLTGLWNIRTGLLILIAAVFFLAYRTGRELFLLMIPVLMAGTAGMDYRKALKVYTAAIGSFLAVTILCSFTGIIPNLVFVGGGRFRSSWGIAYPTDFAALVLFLVLMLWLVWEKMPDGLAVLSILLALWIAISITDSRTSALSCLMFLMIILCRQLSCLEGLQKKRISRADKGIQLLLVFSFILFAAVFWGVLALFVRGVQPAIAFDRVFSGRFAMTSEVLRDQGISALGSNYPQVGLGGTTIQARTYYFLDCSYAMLLIRYGWALSVITTVIWTGMGMRAYRAGDRKLLCAMTVIAFHAMSEHHFLDAQYNVLLVLPFAEIPLKKEQITREKGLSTRIRENWAAICCGSAQLLTIVLVAPLGLNRLRTVFDIWGMDSSKSEIRAILWCATLLLAVGTTAATLCLLASRLQKRQRLRREGLAVLILSLTVLVGMIQTDSHTIRLANESGQIAPEKAEAMQRILDSARGKVVANEKPELIHLHYPGISRSIWYGQDLARQKRTSVVVNLREDNIAFSKKGFQFTQISPDEAIFSNDPSAIMGLTKAGYEWTAYDAAVREVDLKKLAQFNGLDVTEQGSIILENGQRLSHGPYLDFYTGTYQVTFDLKSDIGTELGEPLCSVYVVTLDGKSLAENTIETESLNLDGTCSVEVAFKTTDIRYLQFPVFPTAEYTIEVTGIHYQRIG